MTSPRKQFLARKETCNYNHKYIKTTKKANEMSVPLPVAALDADLSPSVLLVTEGANVVGVIVIGESVTTGAVVGDFVATGDAVVGIFVGILVGIVVGILVGIFVGTTVGAMVGSLGKPKSSQLTSASCTQRSYTIPLGPVQ